MFTIYSVNPTSYSAQIEDWKNREPAPNWSDEFASLGIDFKGKVVLDGGCGPGKYLRYLRESTVRVIGLDREKACLLEAQKLIPSYDELILASLEEQLPIKDGSIDVAFVRYVIHHIAPSQHETVFRNLHKVLSRNGILIIETAFHSQLREHFDHQIFPELTVAAKEIYPDKEELLFALTKAGFELFSVKQTIQEREPYPSIEAALDKSRQLVETGNGPTIWLRLGVQSRENFHARRTTQLPKLFPEGPVPRIWYGTTLVARAT